MPGQTRHPHEILLEELNVEYKTILNGSKQAIYVYLDNEHKTCNAKFAALLGYKTVREYETVPDPMVDVADASLNTLVNAYQNAMQDKIGSTIQVVFKKRGGGTVNTTVMLVPIAFKGEMLALHFITAK